MKRIGQSLKTLPIEVIGLLCDGLQDGLEIVASNFRSHEFAFEMSTCEVMGEAEQVSIFGVLTSLADAIRTHACAAVSGEFTSVREICDLLDKNDSRILKRIKAYVVALNATSAQSISRSMLLNEELFYASWLVTEFNFLSERGYRELVGTERARYLGLLARMPPYVAKLPEEYQSDAFERWQLARLNKIADLLPP